MNFLINFIDQESGGNAFLGIRRVDGSTAVCISLEHDGDVEVTLTEFDFERLVLEIIRVREMLVSPDA